MKTIHYTSSIQFAADESFREWAKSVPGAAFDEWEQWINSHPEFREQIDDAKFIINSVQVHPERITSEASSLLWQKIHAKTLAQHQKLPLLAFSGKRNNRLYYWSAAAVVLIVFVSLSFMMMVQSKGELTYYTSFGEKQQFSLPDGSTVVLNANSQLSYSQATAGQIRRVSLKGEAFFSIVKQSHDGVPVAFSVNTDDAVIEVLGTKFNVNTRRERTQVVLNEGKVRCTSNSSENTIELAPGEASEISEKIPTVTKKRVKPELYSSWKDNRLVFEETSLAEIALMLKELYNLDVTFQDKELAMLLFTGNIPSGNLELFITVLSESFRVTIEQTSTGGLIISRGNQ